MCSGSLIIVSARVYLWHETTRSMELITLTLYCMQIEPQLLSGKNVMISAHGNSLRSIIMYLDKLTSQEVTGVFRIIVAHKFAYRT